MASIKQAPSTSFKLGLEKTGLQYFEITSSSYEIPFIGGKWQHGLTEDEKEIVENHYGHKFEDPASNSFWGDISFPLDHTIQGINLKENPEDLLLVGVLKYMKIISPTVEDAHSPMSGYGFMVTDEDKEEEMKATLYERTDSAISNLLEIKKTKKYLLAFAKYLLPPSIGIGDDTNRAYTKIRDFLDLKLKTSLNPSKKAALSVFENTLNVDKGVLYTTVDFKEALKKNIIRVNGDNYFFNVSSGTQLGKNEEECVRFLMNPKNQDELGTGNKNDKNYSIRYQLKVK